MGESHDLAGRGILYVVATPIGNLRDITLRALEVLAQVDLIACEDTRHTAHLLSAHGITRPLISYFEHNEAQRALELTQRLKQGAAIALVTDAGTPAISDPGYRLVRAAHEAGCVVRAVPGPSAIIAALSIAGLATDRFAFEGFLPAREGPRRARLRELRLERRTMVFFEAARRLSETLAAMTDEFGPDREVAMVRETTKVFEEAVRATLGTLAGRLHEASLKGEITLIVTGEKRGAQPEAGLLWTMEDLVQAGLTPRQAARLLAKAQGRSTRVVYQDALRSKRDAQAKG